MRSVPTFGQVFKRAFPKFVDKVFRWDIDFTFEW